VSAAQLAALIRERQPCVALTGAGVSTESGIPDFRSASGIWAQFDPMQVATIDAFRRDPERCWEFYALRLGVLGDVEPNRGHYALAELERRGLLRAVITQNVDALHTRAGSVEVIEVHGSLRAAVCLRCGAEEPVDAVRAQLTTRPVPLCASCASPLKPGVVMFGELLPEAALDRAFALAREAELLLAVGSTLEVWPVAGLVLEARTLVIVNRGPTAFDGHATLRLEGSAGEILSEVVAAL